MLQARELTKRYGGLTALNRASFDVRPGEIVGYLGPNGSGKSSVAAVVRLGVVLPALLLLPIQWGALGPVSMLTTVVTMLCGWVLVEALMVDWRRIPFTCTYIAGKGFVPQLVLLGFLTFIGFTTVGHGLAYGTAVRSPVFGLIVCALLTAIIFGLRRYRRRASVIEQLQFEDALPTEMNALRLSGD